MGAIFSRDDAAPAPEPCKPAARRRRRRRHRAAGRRASPPVDAAPTQPAKPRTPWPVPKWVARGNLCPLLEGRDLAKLAAVDSGSAAAVRDFVDLRIRPELQNLNDTLTSGGLARRWILGRPPLASYGRMNTLRFVAAMPPEAPSDDAPADRGAWRGAPPPPPLAEVAWSALARSDDRALVAGPGGMPSRCLVLVRVCGPGHLGENFGEIRGRPDRAAPRNKSSTEYPRGSRGVAATCLRGTSKPRRRRDSSPQNIQAAASPRPRAPRNIRAAATATCPQKAPAAKGRRGPSSVRAGPRPALAREGRRRPRRGVARKSHRGCWWIRGAALAV